MGYNEKNSAKFRETMTAATHAMPARADQFRKLSEASQFGHVDGSDGWPLLKATYEKFLLDGANTLADRALCRLVIAFADSLIEDVEHCVQHLCDAFLDVVRASGESRLPDIESHQDPDEALGKLITACRLSTDRSTQWLEFWSRRVGDNWRRFASHPNANHAEDLLKSLDEGYGPIFLDQSILVDEVTIRRRQVIEVIVKNLRQRGFEPIFPVAGVDEVSYQYHEGKDGLANGERRLIDKVYAPGLIVNGEVKPRAVVTWAISAASGDNPV